ncbi:hypothetical protein [Mycolicibacterium brisbanense]|uniref:Uncharacterized protein n=1 Tax=Mycolicibacterium brisbanense TaxID=146020 RepID=A0A100W255_9MYCO|nr:hypothetical protein [Mycolicibacterium brisbanense]MCV7157613.1 hypothetical protein [Mycolicibacterium brisbanense]GAS90254.1 uncharacterized protein RMCB_4350 [Mycolicibacterium brisbanense]
MNVRTLVSPRLEDESAPPAPAAPTDDRLHDSNGTVPVAYSGLELQASTQQQPGAVRDEPAGPDERAPDAGIRARLARLLRRPAGSKPDRVTRYPPRRPDFIADAAMGREMHRL